MPYAARMPNAIEPIHAQINITKFNKSAIGPFLIDFPEFATFAFLPPEGCSETSIQRLLRLSQMNRRVDPDFY
jgi:hypothetical protein